MRKFAWDGEIRFDSCQYISSVHKCYRLKLLEDFNEKGKEIEMNSITNCYSVNYC